MNYRFPATCFLLAFSFLLLASRSPAQHSSVQNYQGELAKYQDSLVLMSRKIVNDPSGLERMNSNYAFTRLLVRALRTPHSFNFPFDSLTAVTIRYAPDRKFRLITWSVMYDDGSYRYYGTVQMNNPDGVLKMHRLVDYSPAIRNPADTVTTGDRWYGAQYYKIVPVYTARANYYVLLGWKGYTARSTKKVIEILSFKDDKAVFGMPVFDGFKAKPAAKRVIFEYARQASMHLDFQAADNTIIFDHLAPKDDKLAGKFENYGPDMSYDGLRLGAGRWRLVEDLRLSNPPTRKDEKFNDPTDPAFKTKGLRRQL